MLNELYIHRDWEITRSNNTLEACEAFLKRYPKGDLADEARSLLHYLQYKMNFESLAKEERSLPIPKERSHTLEEVMYMIKKRADIAKRFKSSLENDKITKEQFDTLMKRNQRHGLGLGHE